MSISNFRKHHFLLSCTFVLCCSFAKSQQVNQFNSWWTYQAKCSLTKQINIEMLYAWCRSDFIRSWHQSLVRGAVNYKHSQTISAGVGYEWIKLFPYGEQPISAPRNEHRLFEYITFKSKIGISSFGNRIRLEQRIIDNKTRHRIRNRLAFKITLFKNKNNLVITHLNLSNEFFVRLSKQTLSNIMEQNRVYGGLSLSINRSFSFSIGYLNQYIIKSNANRENNHTIQVGITHKFELRNQ